MTMREPPELRVGKKDVVLVVGAPRSGTSVVSHVLRECGIDFGREDRFVDPSVYKHNPIFFELQSLNELNDRVFERFGRRYADFDFLPLRDDFSGSCVSGFQQECQKFLEEEFGNSQLIGLKDPRFCFVLPLWASALRHLGYRVRCVWVQRDLGAIVASNARVNQRFSDEHNIRIAALSTLAAAYFLEEATCFRVSYEGMIANPEETTRQLCRWLALGVDEASVAKAASVVDTKLRSFGSDSRALPDKLEKISAASMDGKLGPRLYGDTVRLLRDIGVEHGYGVAGPAAVRGSNSGGRTPITGIGLGESILDSATLYWRDEDSTYLEERSVSMSVRSTPDFVRYEATLPSGIAPVCVRFDPSNSPGAFNLREVQINGEAMVDFRDRVRGVNQYLVDHLGRAGVWFVSNDDDPWIELDVGGLTASDGPTSIQMRCILRPVESVLGALMFSLSDLLANQLSDIHGNLLRQVEALQTHSTELERNLTATAERLNADLAAAGERERAAQQEIRVSQQEISVLAKSMAELRNELEFARTLNADLQANNAMWRAAHRQAHAAETAATGELALIHASTLWRAFVRVRSVLFHVPPPMRKLLRQAMKAGWWVVTPWRTPARIHFLRNRATAERAAVPLRRPLMPTGDEPLPRPGYTYAPPALDSAAMDRTLRSLSRLVSFSVVVPVYDTDPELLMRMIASVESQWYTNWELILVDDHSPSPQTRQVLDDLDDPQITVIRLEENKGISGATNAGIERAHGDFIVFLDHDDELTVDCLYELALCIDRDDPDFLYSDEDKLDVDGSFRDPFFKPDWSPDTLMSTMYTCHVSCVRRSLVLEVGGLRSEYDGSQDWDLVLRITERTSRISHIPKVLYHWRIIPESCASDLQAKPYAIDASRRAREDALHRRGLAGELVPVPGLPGYFRTHYFLKDEPLFSIIIPSKNNGAVLKTCIDSIFKKTAYRKFEVVVINNGSTDAATLDYLADLRAAKQVVVLDHDVPFNYSEINNLGVRHAKGDILVFLNDDTEVLSEQWLDWMGGYAQLPHVGAVGAKLLYPERYTVQHSGVINLRCGPSHAFVSMDAAHSGYFHRNLLEYDWLAVTGACMMVERSKFEKIGGFDESLAVAYNDIDLCFRLHKNGLFQIVCPGITLLHYESLSRGKDTHDAKKLARLDRERELLFRKHPDLLGRDPFHNPNLDPDDPYFGMRAAPHTFTSFAASDHVLELRPGGVQCSLDTVNGQPATDFAQVPRESIVTFTGWAGDGSGHAAGQFAIVLKDNSRGYYASAITGVPRPDVVDALGAASMARSGYRLTASLAGVQPGIYRLYAVNPGNFNVATGLATRLVVQ